QSLHSSRRRYDVRARGGRNTDCLRRCTRHDAARRKRRRQAHHQVDFPETAAPALACLSVLFACYDRPARKGTERMKRSITITINGTKQSAEVEPRMLLIHFLRDSLALTGPHIGCETSICGACTVAVDGKAVKSCTMFAVQCDGRSVTTIEGLASNGNLHPVQEAFWNEHALQCAFCTPGMIMTSNQILE